jgi:membrane associated rhomboid family serine protease
MRRMAPGSSSYSFGPGPLTPAVRFLIALNVIGFVLALAVPQLTLLFGLLPARVLQSGWVWQPVSYMFLHGGVFHLLFNMLALWMFGVELERLWGTRFFTRYYLVTGVGAAVTTILVSLLPAEFAADMYGTVTIGASGAIYGLLLAYALTYPNRPIYMYFVFPIPAKIFVLLIGAIAFFSSVTETRGGVAHAAHLGGILVGYVYLAGLRLHPVASMRAQWMRWRMARMRKRFDVHPGGKSGGPDRWVH